MVLLNIINLDEDIKRMKYMEQQCEKYNIDYIRFSAINGINYKLTEQENIYLKNTCYDKNELKGTLGCFLSHIKLLEKFKNSDDKYIIICEDDIIIDEKFKEYINKCINLIDDYGFINLYNDIDNINDYKLLKNIDNKYSLYDCSEKWVGQGCVSYIINKIYCIDILNKYYNNECNAAIDYFYIWNMKTQSFIYPGLDRKSVV